jgi:ParB family chromosome partitioning protein
MAKLQVSGTAGWNAGRNYYARPMRIAEIKTDPDIAKLFDYQDKMVAEVCRSILENGYDKGQPITLWKDVVVDGHTRLAAAKAAGLEEIPVVEMEFEDKEAAILYTFERQVIRRNLTPAEIMTAVRMLMKKTRNRKGQGRAAEELAQRLGVSASHIYQTRAILEKASEADIQAVYDGEKSTKEVYIGLGKPAAAADKPAVEKKPAVLDSPTLSNRLYLLSAAVTLLAEAKEEKAARLLVNHFFKKHERESFLTLLSEPVRSVIAVCSSGTANDP